MRNRVRGVFGITYASGEGNTVDRSNAQLQRILMTLGETLNLVILLFASLK